MAAERLKHSLLRCRISATKPSLFNLTVVVAVPCRRVGAALRRHRHIRRTTEFQFCLLTYKNR
jgi:hypothetical protein